MHLHYKPKRRHAAPGYMLASVVILVFAMGIVAASFLSMAGHETRASQVDLDSQRAFWLAEAGRERAIRQLSDPSVWNKPPEGDVQLYNNEPGPAQPDAAVAHRGTYTVDVVVDTLGAYAVEKQFMIESVGTYAGKTRRVNQRIKMTSFAQYAYFTNEETFPSGDVIWFITGDRIEGQTHSNGTFRIRGDPVFLSRVTSASEHMIGYRSSGQYIIHGPSDWPCGINHPTFAEGFELGIETIPLPTQTGNLRGMASGSGILLANATDIEIGWRGGTNAVDPVRMEAGWLHYRNTGATGYWTERQVSSIGSRVVYCDQNARIKGVLDGELTIASARDIWIFDDVTYQASDANGTPQPGCNDLLGLVANRNIVYEYDLVDTYDLKVNAVMMSLNTSIYAEDYEDHPLRGTLTIWGGLIQKNRGAVGTFDASGIKTGYLKNYHYDTRVTARTPPGYPLTGVYEEITWMETWDDSYPF